MSVITQLTKWMQQASENAIKKLPRISVYTLDNPGWRIVVDLDESSVKQKSFSNFKLETSDDDWIVCKKEGSQIKGYCGPKNLIELLDIFLNWAVGSKQKKNLQTKNDSSLQQLMDWYEFQCDEHWEHCYGMHFCLQDNMNWEIYIDLRETDLEDRQFNPIKKHNDSQTWVDCYVEDNKFHAACGLHCLNDVFCVFIDWTKEHN